MNILTKNIILSPFNILYKINPKFTLKTLFYLKQRYKLDLNSPKTYNEKIQWIKLYDKNPLMPECCDKYMVRSYVEKMGCGELLNNLIWCGRSADVIPFDKLPEKCVIKVTHGSSFNIIVTNKNNLNRNDVIRKCNKWLSAKFIPCYGEWFYGIIPPRVIVEEYIESDDGNQLKDYKVFCFNGRAEYIRIDSDRFTSHKADMYDRKWNYIVGENTGFKMAGDVFKKPEMLDDMLNYAEKLSLPFLHARVDFYISKGKLIFGEITFTNGAGFDRFSSYEFDLEMGKKLNLKYGGKK